MSFCTLDGEVLDDDPTSIVNSTLDGQYHIESMLGKGGMGAVYRARHILLGDRVAIKVLPPQMRNNAEWLRRFRREGQAARRFRHPNAVTVYDLRTTADGMIYMVMEYVEGNTLDAELKRRTRFSPAEALTLLEPIMSVLNAAHEQGVVHRDLKPENIMIGKAATGSAPVMKLLDLGIAKISELAGPTDQTAGPLTVAGQILGTPYYMSPEQWGEMPRDGSAEIDGRADIYSLGVVFYELVSGQRPFKGFSLPEVRREHIAITAPLLNAIVNDVPMLFGAAIARAMEKDRADRQSTAAELANELRTALGMPSLSASAFSLPPSGSTQEISTSATPTFAPDPYKTRTDTDDKGLLTTPVVGASMAGATSNVGPVPAGEATMILPDPRLTGPGLQVPTSDQIGIAPTMVSTPNVGAVPPPGPAALAPTTVGNLGELAQPPAVGVPPQSGAQAGLLDRTMAAPLTSPTLGGSGVPAGTASHLSAAGTSPNLHQPQAPPQAVPDARDLQQSQAPHLPRTPAHASDFPAAQKPKSKAVWLVPVMLLLVLVVGAVAVVGVFVAYPYFKGPGPRGGGGPSPEPTAVTPATPEAFNFWIETTNDTTKPSGTRQAELQVSLKSGESFRFHFAAPKDGYFYLIVPGDKGVPTTYLTDKLPTDVGVNSNELKSGADFEYPRGNWFTLDQTKGTDVYTLIYSHRKIAELPFLSEMAGKALKGEELAKLQAFAAKYKANEADSSVHNGNTDTQSVSIKTVSNDESDNPVVYEFRIQHN